MCVCVCVSNRMFEHVDNTSFSLHVLAPSSQGTALEAPRHFWLAKPMTNFERVFGLHSISAEARTCYFHPFFGAEMSERPKDSFVLPPPCFSSAMGFANHHAVSRWA